MTRTLGELLGANQPQFNRLIQRLERAAGWPSADIRITHDVAAEIREALRFLHLDVQESTNREIYAALQNRVHIDEQYILQGLSVHNTNDIELLLWSIQRFVQKQVQSHNVLAVRSASFKRLLRAQAPKKTMKALGYRSLDSMLKHESVASLVTAVSICESQAWHKKFTKQYQNCTLADFEERPIEVFQPRTERWNTLGVQASQIQKQNIMVSHEVGVVAILPVTGYHQGLAIVDLVLALVRCNDIFAASSYLKLQQLTPSFGHEVAQIATLHETDALRLGDHDVSWQTLHRYLAQRGDVHYFEPYVDGNDLYVISVEQTLSKLHPAMSFWESIHHALRQDATGLLSCNILDVAINYYNKLGYMEASVHYARKSLWHELTSRYLNPKTVEEQLLPVLQPVPQEVEVPRIS